MVGLAGFEPATFRSEGGHPFWVPDPRSGRIQARL